MPKNKTTNILLANQVKHKQYYYGLYLIKSNKSLVFNYYMTISLFPLILIFCHLSKNGHVPFGFNWKEINRGSPGSLLRKFRWNVQKCLKFVQKEQILLFFGLPTTQFTEYFLKTQTGDPQLFSLWMYHISPQFIMTEILKITTKRKILS